MKNRIVYVASYHHIDVLDTITNPERLDELVAGDQLPCTLKSAAEAFKKAGWEGDGEIAAIWVPPFALLHECTWGVRLWHVKQWNNGTSWLGAKKPYTFPRFDEARLEWKAIQVNERVPKKIYPF